MATRKTPAKSPAYTWYPGDHAKDERESTMPVAAYGLWRRLFDHAWDNDGLPDDPARIFALPFCTAWCASRPKFDQLWMHIEPLFPPDGNGRRRNPEMEAHREKQRKKSRQNKFAAHRSWETRRESRVASAVPMHSVRSADALPVIDVAVRPSQCLSISSSSSISDPDQKEQKEQCAPKPRAIRAVLDVFEVRRHLLAACHRLMETGPPYVSAAGVPDAEALLAALKHDVGPKLGAVYQRTDELVVIVDTAIGQRSRAGAADAWREGRRQRRARALKHARGGRL